MRTDRLYSVIGALLVAACVLGAVPVLEMGVNDDWSYTYIARELASSGHLIYTGWAVPMIGLQAWWAALLIKLFGFSFTLVRLSTLPFAVGCALLLYRLARYAGLNPSFALFGALVVALSPLFIPLAASFMTDIPAFFFWLACVYCGTRAVQANSALRASGWIAATAAVGVGGGTVRQLVWGAPLLLLPCVAWIRRKDRALVAATALLWCVAALAIAMCLHWYQAQPYARPETYSGGLFPSLDLLREAAEALLELGVTCLLLILPILSIHLAGWRNSLRAPLALALGLLISGALWGAVLWVFDGDLLLGNIITANGILYPGTEAMGFKPEILARPVRGLLALALFGSAGVSAAVLLESLRRRLKGPTPAASFPAQAGVPPARLFAFLYVPLSIIYALAILYRDLNDGALFDRYVIPLLPALVVPLLWHYQKIRQAPPALGWVAIGLFALYGVATTHDYLAAGRARLQAASSLTSAGIPRTRITAGLEYDGWTELEQSGHVNDERIRIPPRAYRPQQGRRYAVSPPYWFWDETPSIEPRYFVLYSPLPGLLDSPFPPARYTTWLPPFHRQVFTQMAPQERW